jgi:hypothetical protein
MIFKRIKIEKKKSETGKLADHRLSGRGCAEEIIRNEMHRVSQTKTATDPRSNGMATVDAESFIAITRTRLCVLEIAHMVSVPGAGGLTIAK